MKGFFRNVSPRRAIVDLWQVLGTSSEFRWPGLVLALIVTGSIFSIMVHQGGQALPPPPKVIYFNSWRADRSEAEIIAGNIAASRKARAEAAEEARRAEDVRQMYKAVGAATGFDTETMYKNGNAERDRLQKAEAARNQAVLDRHLDKSEKPIVDPDAQRAGAQPSPQ